jgi:hypothetical protein
MEEADERLVIISPYYNLSNWTKLINTLQNVISRGIAPEVYVRENEGKSIQELRAIGIEPQLIPRLHTKLYFNEKYAIVSSMNLTQSSDDLSLDIAMKSENVEEYQKLLEYYNRYIVRAALKHTPERPLPKVNRFIDWRAELEQCLTKVFNATVYITEYEQNLQIKGRNNYEVDLNSYWDKPLKLSGILSGREYAFAKKNARNLFEASNMTIELREGRNNNYDTICGKIGGFRSKSFPHFQPDEGSNLVEVVVGFISGIEQMKKMA